MRVLAGFCLFIIYERNYGHPGRLGYRMPSAIVDKVLVDRCGLHIVG